MNRDRLSGGSRELPKGEGGKDSQKRGQFFFGNLVSIILSLSLSLSLSPAPVGIEDRKGKNSHSRHLSLSPVSHVGTYAYIRGWGLRTEIGGGRKTRKDENYLPNILFLKATKVHLLYTYAHVHYP